MSLLTSGKIEKLRGVIDRNGDLRPPANADQLGNFPELEQFVYSTSGTSAEPLAAKDVPEGVTVLVEYAEGNSGTVYVGDSGTQQAPLTSVGDGRTFRVSDTSSIYIRAPTSGDGVVVSFEVTA